MYTIITYSTHVIYSIDEWIVTAVAHCKPVTAKEHNVYIAKSK